MSSRLLRVILILIPIGIILAIAALVFVIVVILNPDWWWVQKFPLIRETVSATSMAAMVIATLVLAWGTFSVINSDRQREKRNRKERLLNEIIDWALEGTKTAIFRQTTIPHELWETRLKYKYSISHGKYIKRIVIAHFSKLESLFNEVLNRLDIALRYTQKFAEKSATKADLLECEQQVAESVEKLIEEAAKIKTENLT